MRWSLFTLFCASAAEIIIKTPSDNVNLRYSYGEPQSKNLTFPGSDGLESAANLSRFPYLIFQPSGDKYTPEFLGLTVLAGIDWLGHRADLKDRQVILPNFHGLEISFTIVADLSDHGPIAFQLISALTEIFNHMFKYSLFETGVGLLTPFKEPYGTFSIRRAKVPQINTQVPETSRRRREIQNSRGSTLYPLDPGLEPKVISSNQTLKAGVNPLMQILAGADFGLLQYSIFAIPPTEETSSVWGGNQAQDWTVTVSASKGKDWWTTSKKYNVLRAVEMFAWVSEWQVAQPRPVYSNFTVSWKGDFEFSINITRFTPPPGLP